MIRTNFIHFGDLHLGTKFLGIRDPEKVKKRRQEHREVFRNIILIINEIKKKEGIDFVIIAGDLFEHDSFSPDIIGFLKYGLESLEVPVFITPGNHDQIVDDSPYLIFDWPSNVHIFKKKDFEKIKLNGDVFIHGIAVHPDNREENVIRNYQIEEKDKINIVCFHGSEITSKQEDKQWGICFPFKAEDIKNLDADYLALGHYHNARQVPLNSEKILGFYCGCPEPTNFLETGEKYILKVEVEKGKPPVVKKISKQQERIYHQIVIDCSKCATIEEIKDKIAQYKDKNSCIVNIIFKGYIDPGIEFSLEDIDDFISRHNLFFSWLLTSEVEIDYSPSLILESPLAQEFLKIIDEENKKFEGKGKFFEMVKILGLDAIFRKEVRRWDEI